MKKILSGIVAIVVLLAMATSVNAASVVADKTEVNKGDKVVVSVNLEKETRNIDVKLTYDASKFEFVSGSATSTLGSLTVNDKNSGKIIVSGSNPTQSTKQVSFTFVAKENTDASAFTASGLVTESDEEFTISSASVKVIEKVEEPTKPVEDNKNDDNNKEENKNDDNKNEQTPTKNDENKTTETVKGTETKVDTNGNKITKLPQTGISYVAIAAVVIIAAVATVIVKRNIK